MKKLDIFLFVILLGLSISCTNSNSSDKIELRVKSTGLYDEWYDIVVTKGQLYVKTKIVELLTLDTIIKEDSILISVSEQEELSRMARKVFDSREIDTKGFVHDGIICVLNVNSHEDKFFPYGDSIKMTPQWKLYQFLIKKAPLKMKLRTGA